nr:site-specific integrase [Pseudonocardia sp. DSM 110487]
MPFVVRAAPSVRAMATYKRRTRSRGRVEQLPSGSLRAVVYAGTDPLTGRRHFLREVIPAGPKAADEAEKAVRRLAAQVDERKHPRTNATLDQLLDRYLETLDVAESTRKMYAKYAEKHIRPFVGRLKAGAVDVEVLDSLYAELRRCRVHCDRSRGLVDHRTPRRHECDSRCRPHRCNGLSSTTIRHIHFVLCSAYEKGVRWRWVSQNPVKLVDAPRPTAPDPQPPTPAEAAQIVEEAWQDPDWGMLVWLTMVTGARRGELCGLRWSHVDLPGAVLHDPPRDRAARDGAVREGHQDPPATPGAPSTRRRSPRSRSTTSAARRGARPSTCRSHGTLSCSRWRRTAAGRSCPHRCRSGTAGSRSGSTSTRTCIACGTTPRPSSSQPASTCGPLPAGSGTVGAV